MTTTSLTVNWGAATDSKTAQADLRYKLVMSTSNNIGDATAAEANGTLLLNWTANTLTKAVTGLSDETTYYFTVLVKNDDDLVTAYSSTTSKTFATVK